MIDMEIMRRARSMVIAEIETGRNIIPMPFDVDVLNALSDQDLADMASNLQQWTVSETYAVNFPKADGQSMRRADYISPQDRVAVMAALLSEADKIYDAVKPFNGEVNYDRPLPQSMDEELLYADYHETYQDYKQRIWADEAAGRWVVHADIREFAGSCDPKFFLKKCEDIGFSAETISVLANIFEQWSDQGIKGIPQGYTLTDLMLKIYLLDVDDKFMQMDHMSYYRYVDDIIISAEDKETAKNGVAILNAQLNKIGLNLKETALHYAKPGETGHGHSYRPASQLEAIKTTIEEMNALHPLDLSVEHEDIVRIAYKRFMAPSNPKHEERPKYLISYLLREMREHGMTDFVTDLKGLLEKYPDRTAKLLKSAIKVVGATTALNGLAGYFFNSHELNDRSKDGSRLEYLALLNRENYAVSQFDMMRLLNVLPTVTSERKAFAPYSQAVQNAYGRNFERDQSPKLTR